jgi:hypothetical protein
MAESIKQNLIAQSADENINSTDNKPSGLIAPEKLELPEVTPINNTASAVATEQPNNTSGCSNIVTAETTATQTSNGSVVQTTPTGGDPTPVSQGQFKFLWEIVIAIATLAVIAFITLVIQYFTATQATYQNLVNQVTAQNAKIDNFNILLNQATVQNVKIDTFQNLANQVTAQNAKIDTLIQLNIKK